MAWHWWIIGVGFIDLILCAFLCRFFGAVHRWDEEIHEMHEE